jgi:hypothetical protein
VSEESSKKGFSQIVLFLHEAPKSNLVSFPRKRNMLSRLPDEKQRFSGGQRFGHQEGIYDRMRLCPETEPLLSNHKAKRDKSKSKNNLVSDKQSEWREHMEEIIRLEVHSVPFPPSHFFQTFSRS